VITRIHFTAISATSLAMESLATVTLQTGSRFDTNRKMSYCRISFLTLRRLERLINYSEIQLIDFSLFQY
jgi:hypothetical protein